MVAALSTRLSAQMEIGVAGGPNLYQMQGIYSSENGDYRPGVRFGWPLKFYVNNYLRVKTGLFANKKASKIKGHDFFNDPIERMYSVTYWEIDGQLEAYY